MGNILGVGNMWIFVPTGEPDSETRPHVHVARMNGNKRVNMKFWLGPEVELAKRHKSFKDAEVTKAMRLVRQNWQDCIAEWVAMYGDRLVRG